MNTRQITARRVLRHQWIVVSPQGYLVFDCRQPSKFLSAAWDVDGGAIARMENIRILPILLSRRAGRRPRSLLYSYEYCIYHYNFNISIAQLRVGSRYLPIYIPLLSLYTYIRSRIRAYYDTVNCARSPYKYEYTVTAVHPTTYVYVGDI